MEMDKSCPLQPPQATDHLVHHQFFRFFHCLFYFHLSTPAAKASASDFASSRFKFSAATAFLLARQHVNITISPPPLACLVSPYRICKRAARRSHQQDYRSNRRRRRSSVRSKTIHILRPQTAFRKNYRFSSSSFHLFFFGLSV